MPAAFENGYEKSIMCHFHQHFQAFFLVWMIHENIKKDACSNENESVLTGENKNASVVVFFEMKTDSFEKCISGPGP